VGAWSGAPERPVGAIRGRGPTGCRDPLVQIPPRGSADDDPRPRRWPRWPGERAMSPGFRSAPRSHLARASSTSARQATGSPNGRIHCVACCSQAHAQKTGRVSGRRPRREGVRKGPLHLATGMRNAHVPLGVWIRPLHRGPLERGAPGIFRGALLPEPFGWAPTRNCLGLSQGIVWVKSVSDSEMFGFVKIIDNQLLIQGLYTCV